jgi:hypothetical protein
MEWSSGLIRKDEPLVVPQWSKPEPFGVLGRAVLPQTGHTRVRERNRAAATCGFRLTQLPCPTPASAQGAANG